MSKKSDHVPKYCLHKRSGRAYVRIQGRQVYLGPFGSAESRKAYRRILAEIDVPAPPLEYDENLTVVQLCAEYMDFCVGYYRKNGLPTRTVEQIKLAIRLIKGLYGRTLAAEFGPLALQDVRQTMIDRKLSRHYINAQIHCLKRIFKWGVSRELLKPSAFEALRSMDGLRKGRSQARETASVGPVPDEVINATLFYLPAMVADMVRLQRLTGARPGEICQVRPIDVDRSKAVWEYRLASHKTEHLDKQRLIFIGPRGQDILRPYLLRPADAFCFQPLESEQHRNANRRSKRKTRIQPSQQNRRKTRRKRPPADRYDKSSYRRAIARAVVLANKQIQADAEHMGIDKPAFLPNWHPNQLRHSAATQIRRDFGLEAAQIILGHSKADTTEIYAQRDAKKAIKIVNEIG